MVESLERISVDGGCLLCKNTGCVDIVYASAGFDMWYDCVHCGELEVHQFKKGSKSSLDGFMVDVLEGRVEDDST